MYSHIKCINKNMYYIRIKPENKTLLMFFVLFTLFN